MPTRTLSNSKITEADSQALLERLADKVSQAHDSLLRHILDIDLAAGGGRAHYALAALSALTEAMAEHYVLEMRINLIRHRKQFMCVPIDAWNQAKQNLAAEQVAQMEAPPDAEGIDEAEKP